MMQKLCLFAALLAAGLASSNALAQQYLMMPEWTNDRVVLLNATTGDILDPEFIPAGGGVYDLNNPKSATQVGNEIWVTATSSIKRFTAANPPVYLGEIPGLFLARGASFVNGTYYVATGGNSGAGVPAGIRMFSPAGVEVGFFAVPNPFDVTPYQGGLLVSDIDNDDVIKFSYTGINEGIVLNSDGASSFDFAQQIHVASDGILLAGFSAPAGFYKFNFNGTLNFSIPITIGLRGVWQLPDGRILWCEGGQLGGMRRYNPATQTSELLTPGFGPQNISLLTLTPPSTCGTADFDGDGDSGTDADIEAFFSCLAGTCCSTCFGADFDGDGDTGTDADIEAFFRVLAGQPC